MMKQLILGTVLLFGLFEVRAEASYICRGMLAELMVRDRLSRDIEHLTKRFPDRHFLNADSLNWASEYIYRELESFGLRPEYQSFEVGGEVYRNVRVLLGPSTAERIVIGAHYDVCSTTPGADDNASGVAGLLELARQLYLAEANLQRRVELVAYTLEEPPTFGTDKMGSAFHAKMLKEEGVPVVLMIALDGLGYFTDEPNSQKAPVIRGRAAIASDRGNFIAIIGKRDESAIVERLKGIFEDVTDLPVESVAVHSLVPGANLSDHRNYWANGFRAVLVTDTAYLRNPHYHAKTDSLATLDFERMQKVIQGVFGIVLRY